MKKWTITVAFLLTAVCCARETVAPESGFLVLGRYTNAFFGFSLPLPADPSISLATVTLPGWRPLLGLVQKKGDTKFAISAQQMSPTEATKLMRYSPPIWIGNQEFSKAASQKEGHPSTLYDTIYETVSGNFLLLFRIQSMDPAVAKEFERCVEQIRFFDPSKAKEIAGPNATPYSPAPSDHSHK